MDVSFEHACGLVGAALQGPVRRQIVDGLAGKTLGASLLALRDAMRANRFRAGGQQIFLDRVITSFDGRTRAEGFHILHDWDGVSQQSNPDSIPVDVLHFLADQRGAEPANAAELAILLDYYFMHVLALLTMRVWDDGDPNENFALIDAMLADLQGPNGSGHQFAADAATLMLIGTSHYEPEEWGYGKLLAKVRTLDEHQQFRIGLGHASSMGCHLRFGFEAQCGRDTLALRDDNIADYPWLCFALAAVMREYSRLADAGLAGRTIAVIEETLLNGLTADARAFVGVPPPSLIHSEADRVRFVDGFARHKAALLESFQRYRPTDTAYSPLSFFFNFSHNVMKGQIVDSLLWSLPWPVGLNDLFTGEPRTEDPERSREQLARTLTAYARTNPHTIRGRLMPVIVYDPDAGYRGFRLTLRRLRE